MNTNKNAQDVTTLVASVILAAMAQFFGTVVGPGIGLVVALLLPPAMTVLAHFFEVEPAVWAPALASLLGTALVFAVGREEALVLVGPPLALALSAILAWRRRRNGQRCELCNGRVAGQVSFTCPRCALLVCEARCWDFERLRCRLCVQNHVPVLPVEGGWWEHNLGAAARQGRCLLCQGAPEQVDLRNCANCGRAQCRECWDDANGTCSRCGWVVAELPELLKPIV
jgi:hypothetical protein